MKGGLAMEDTVLIVDDEAPVLSAIKRALADEPYKVFTAISAEDALKLMKRHLIKVVISDEMMPGMSGTEFLSIVKERYPETIRIILTGHASIEAAMRAVNKGEVYRFLTKPWENFELKLVIRTALEKYNLEEENRRLLRTVKYQALELKLLERKYPEITRLERDEDGNLIIEDISDEEFERIIAQCEREFS